LSLFDARVRKPGINCIFGGILAAGGMMVG
jgi:hypothetical protein